MFCSPVCKVRTLLLLIFFSSNFMVPKLPVTHLRVAVPIKIELRLFRSKTVCSYNVLLSCLQSADRHSLLFGPMFVNNFSRQILLSHSVFSIFYYIYMGRILIIKCNFSKSLTPVWQLQGVIKLFWMKK